VLVLTGVYGYVRLVIAGEKFQQPSVEAMEDGAGLCASLVRMEFVFGPVITKTRWLLPLQGCACDSDSCALRCCGLEVWSCPEYGQLHLLVR